MSALDPKRTAEFALGGAVRHLNARQDDAAHRPWATVVRDLADADRKPVSLRDWMREHDGQHVLTAQFTVDVMTQNVVRVWMPAARRIEVRATYVRFIEEDDVSWSRRDFTGVRALRHSESAWIGYDGSTRQVIVYRVVES